MKLYDKSNWQTRDKNITKKIAPIFANSFITGYEIKLIDGTINYVI